MNVKRTIIGALAVGALLAPAGCERGSNSTAPEGKPANGDAAAALPADLFAEAAPADAVDVAKAKSAAKVGETIVVRGRIGGGVEPFVAERAVLTVVDPSLPACSDDPGDTCKTPWDYCCEPAEKLAAHSATIQVVDAAGRPLKTGLKGRGALKPLAEIVVKGKVAAGSDAKVLIINAETIFVKKS